MKVISKKWEDVLTNLWTPELLSDLSNFRQNDINYKLCMRNPKGDAKRSVKDLLYLCAMQMSNYQWQLLKNIKHRNFGNPLVVTVKGEVVDLDYVRAVLELTFVLRNWVYTATPTIVDIGGGYGRLCHSFFSTINIGHYYVVDLVPVLGVAQRYLSEVLSADDFARVSFLPPENVEDIRDVDLALNVDSMNEMPYEMGLKYIDFIDRKSKAFYSKNPVGKYYVEDPDETPYGKNVVEDTLSTGILCDKIEMFNSESVERLATKFVSVYCPGVHWKKIEDGWARPWWHYWEVFYEKKQ